MRPRIVGTTVLLVCAFAVNVRAQNASLRVEVRAEQRAVVEAAVVVKGMTYRTGADGTVTIDIPAGAIEIVVAKEGFAPASVSIELRPDERRLLSIELQPQAAVEEHVTVAATRTDKRIDDQAMRVETLDREEIEEKMMMTPGDIVMMLNEMGGLRVQASSPSLGAATVRIQGMRGRYTRVLSDGLPLFGEQAGSFGLLQIPPSDLGRVEVIKGVASSLYGAGAMGGVVNLVSRRPGTEAEQEVLLNRSSRGATDGVFWYAAPLNERWSATLLAGGHGQTRSDANSDGWADLPKYARLAARPRVFWDDHAGRSFFATAGVTLEDRSGGTVPGHVLPATGHKYEESLGTRRYDGGVVAQTILKQQYVVSARASITYQHQDHRFDEVDERAAHTTVFAEATVRRAVGKHTLVAGAALERDAYRPEDLTQFRYTYIVPGLFVQDDIDVSSWLSLSASTRVDSHNEFGWFASPRIAVLLRHNGWSSRTSLGTGFFAPTPLTEETEAAGLSRLVIRGPLRAERARSASFDLTRTVRSLSATMTVFLSSIHDPIEVDRSDAFLLRNLSSPLTNRGLELLTTWRQAPFSLTATYSYVRSTERVDDVNQSVPLTPRHSAGLVGMWEREGRGRVGLEWYYTGRQRLDADPFRDVSRAYSVFGALVERRVGRYRLFVNAENLANVRQTDWEPLLRRSRGVDGRWTVDAWAPLDGRTINGGVRVAF